MGIKVSDISFGWDGGSEYILKDLSLDIKNKTFVSFVGPSGCGKSTLLNIISGLLNPNEGNVFVNNNKVTEPSKNLGFVFQDYSLFPWLTVRKNVEYGMKINGIEKVKRKEISDTILQKVGLLDAAKKYPYQLSGGMKQRTAIARVLANDSEYILMDEPFGALDYQTRLEMQSFLLEIWLKFEKTILFVTHNVDEAVFLSDKIFLMSTGTERKIKELDVELPRPREISSLGYNRYREEIIEHLKKNVNNDC